MLKVSKKYIKDLTDELLENVEELSIELIGSHPEMRLITFGEAVKVQSSVYKELIKKLKKKLN